MWNDPIVEEIHKIREQHAAKFNYDLRAIVKEYQKLQKQTRKPVVSFTEKHSDVTSGLEVAEQ